MRPLSPGVQHAISTILEQPTLIGCHVLNNWTTGKYLHEAFGQMEDSCIEVYGEFEKRAQA